MKPNPKPIPFIRTLLHDNTEAEILEAEETFREYLEVIKEICERLEQEKQFDNER